LLKRGAKLKLQWILSIEQERVVAYSSKNKWKGENFMDNWLKNKIAIVVGERDGVQGPSIAKCLEAAGASVVYAVTECFV
jgi:glycine/sarcosine/betaine reductase complex component A